MTPADILRMAREAGLGFFVAEEAGAYVPECLGRFAALVAAAEREECAKACEQEHCFGHPAEALDWAADAIRGRGTP